MKRFEKRKISKLLVLLVQFWLMAVVILKMLKKDPSFAKSMEDFLLFLVLE